MTDTSNHSKADLRREMRARIKALSPEQRREASMQACARLGGLDDFERALMVMLYMPLPDEPDLTPAAIRCFQQGKSVCVPFVDWRREDMYAVEANTFDDEQMELDERGLRRPREGRPIPVSAIDLIVVPGLAFDAQGRRLGRGGGFYDRFLTRLSNRTVRVGLAFDVQIVESVPVENHDGLMDVVVTDRRVTRGATRQRIRPRR